MLETALNATKNDKCISNINDLPIGVFDSGVGGLTVVREIMQQLPNESILYFGDTLRCPYGPRPLDEIKTFARQISHWLLKQDVKLIVIACNSATAAALETIQQELIVPVIGVVAPGARAAVKATLTNRVGVIGPEATVNSDIYSKAIRALQENITVFSEATPSFVDIVEQGLHNSEVIDDLKDRTSSAHISSSRLEIARTYLSPFKSLDVDTLVLGCTHFPLLIPLIAQVMGADVKIISSAEETARDVASVLAYREQLASGVKEPKHRYVTTALNTDEFAEIGSAILEKNIPEVQSVSLDELGAGSLAKERFE